MSQSVVLSTRSLRFLPGVSLGVALSLAVVARAQTPPAEVLTPLVVSVIAAPVPVAGADGRVHLVYEVALLNQSSLQVRVESIEVLDAGNGDAVIATLHGTALAQALRISGGFSGTSFDPSHSGYVFMDVSLPAGAPPPRALAHRFALKLEVQPPDAAQAGPAPPPEITFVGAPTTVLHQIAVVLAPPLAGPRWVVTNGCCKDITAHRGATLAINGQVYVAERFAIDFEQLLPDGRIANGDPTKLGSYGYFGANVYSVAEGVVVGTQDDLPEEVPGKLPANATIQSAGGNYVVVDIGDGRFAFYAHMQPGSLRVKRGDRVQRGQVIGLLGNSGNTDAPHLHFHVMDGPSPLRANGLPYVFTSFVGTGVVKDEKALETNEPADIDAETLRGPHRDQLPMNLQVVEFPVPAAN